MITITIQEKKEVDIKVDPKQVIYDVLKLLKDKQIINCSVNQYVYLCSKNKLVSIYETFESANIFDGEKIRLLGE